MWLTSRSGHFTLGERALVPIDLEARWGPKLVWTFRQKSKISFLHRNFSLQSTRCCCQLSYRGTSRLVFKRKVVICDYFACVLSSFKFLKNSAINDVLPVHISFKDMPPPIRRNCLSTWQNNYIVEVMEFRSIQDKPLYWTRKFTDVLS